MRFTHANLQDAQAALAAYRANPAAPYPKASAHFVDVTGGVEVRCIDAATGYQFRLSNPSAAPSRTYAAGDRHQ